MKTVLLLGATGHLGSVLLTSLLRKNYSVIAFVRNPQKVKIKHTNLTIITGDVTNKEDLLHALSTSDIVISTLGHGFRTNYPIQEKTLRVLLPLMEQKHITRFITVTGAGLLIKGDPKSFIASFSEKMITLFDPYRMSDAKAQQALLEKSTSNWTVVRTPLHNNNPSQIITHIGYTQPKPWNTLSRKAIAAFIIDCLEKNDYNKKAPIIS